MGECGDGKSTLIQALLDPNVAQDPPATGKKARGVTKNITEYRAVIHGQQVILIDTPGVGDKDVTPTRLLSMIENELHGKQVDAVITTTPIPDARVKLGAQVVQLLVDKGFVGEEKWQKTDHISNAF